MATVLDSPARRNVTRARRNATLTPAPGSALARALANLEIAIRTTLPTVSPSKAVPVAEIIPAAPIVAAPVALPAPTLAPIVANRPTDFDVTRHDGTIAAYNPATGVTARFRVVTEDWGSKTVRVASHHDGSTFVAFAFVDDYGVRPWGMSSKSAVPFDMRTRYARFLENLNGATARGVDLTIVRD